jgi:hypothetical protein
MPKNIFNPRLLNETSIKNMIHDQVSFINLFNNFYRYE